MATLFISDLHLDPARPEVTKQALAFLDQDATQAEAFYILGDLFEAWIGDDDPDPEKRRFVSALRQLPDRNIPCFVMHGNRDFLIGDRFCEETGFELLADPTMLDLYGDRVLVTHGDTLCTDDIEYQKFRAMVRNPAWQKTFLAMPIPQRLALAQQVRDKSRAATMLKASEIMDVNQATVEQTLREHGIRILLHGHTHRPDIHRFELDGQSMTRIVLGDWHESGSVLRWDDNGFELLSLPR